MGILLQGDPRLDAAAADPFADIFTLARSTFEDVEFDVDDTPDRALLRLEAVKALVGCL
jgi:hypothetical protein